MDDVWAAADITSKAVPTKVWLMYFKRKAVLPPKVVSLFAYGPRLPLEEGQVGERDQRQSNSEC